MLLLLYIATAEPEAVTLVLTTEAEDEEQGQKYTSPHKLTPKKPEGDCRFTRVLVIPKHFIGKH